SHTAPHRRRPIRAPLPRSGTPRPNDECGRRDGLAARRHGAVRWRDPKTHRAGRPADLVPLAVQHVEEATHAVHAAAGPALDVDGRSPGSGGQTVMNSVVAAFVSSVLSAAIQLGGFHPANEGSLRSGNGRVTITLGPKVADPDPSIVSFAALPDDGPEAV